MLTIHFLRLHLYPLSSFSNVPRAGGRANSHCSWVACGHFQIAWWEVVFVSPQLPEQSGADWWHHLVLTALEAPMTPGSAHGEGGMTSFQTHSLSPSLCLHGAKEFNPLLLKRTPAPSQKSPPSGPHWILITSHLPIPHHSEDRISNKPVGSMRTVSFFATRVCTSLTASIQFLDFRIEAATLT